MGEKNRHFTREFKLTAVQLVTEKGMPIRKVARDLDIDPNLLHLWRRKFLKEGDKAFTGKGRVKPENAEIRKLRKDLEKAREERDILKKALAVFSKPKQMKYEFMEEHRETYKVKSMCEVLKVVPAMLTADIDPERTRFSVHHYAQEGLPTPPTIEEWQKRTGHQILFNAGLFRENFAYLGLLYKDGRSLGSRRHQTWQGLFVAELSTSGLKKARVLDLASDNFDELQPAYREAAQALMLLDRTGKIRVRQTGKLAYQTIVAVVRVMSTDVAALLGVTVTFPDNDGD